MGPTVERLRDDILGGGLLPTPAGVTAEVPLTVIERRRGWQVVDLDELWRYRELLFFLTWRDVKVRYKQTALGAAWAILQPLATMLVFSLFFRKMSAADSAVPYPLFVFAGLLPWMFFANAISAAAQSVITNQNLITKVYFPRLIIPISAVAAGLVDLVVALSMLPVLMLCYGVLPGWTTLAAPLIVCGLAITALGVGMLLSAVMVPYRDFRHVVPFLVQFWMFSTPAVYLQGDEIFGRRMASLLPVNPAHGLIVNFRQAMLGGPLDLYSLAISGAVSVTALLLGATCFQRIERLFADII